MIRFATTLMAAVVLAGFAGKTQAAAINIDHDNFRVVDTSYKWMSKYGGMMTDGQINAAGKLMDKNPDKYDQFMAKLEQKTEKKYAKWMDKLESKPTWVDNGTGGVYVNKAKGANFFVDSANQNVDVMYDTAFQVDSKKHTGSVGFVFGMTGVGTEDVSYLVAVWHDNKVKQGVELLLVDDLHNGKNNVKKNGLAAGTGAATVLDSDYSVGGFGDGVNGVMISYLADSVSVSIGGTELSAEGEFEAGEFGYFVFGQKGVTFGPTTAEDVSTMSSEEIALLLDGGSDAKIANVVVASAPTPAALPAGMAMMMLAATRRKRRSA